MADRRKIIWLGESGIYIATAEKGRELEDTPKGRGGRAMIGKAHGVGREEGE